MIQQEDTMINLEAIRPADAYVSHIPGIHTKAVVESYNRPPRIWTSPSQETVTLPSPAPKEVLPDFPGITSLILPLVMMGMIIGIYALVSHGSLQQLAFILPMALFSLVSPLSTFLQIKQRRKAIRRRQTANDLTYQEILTKLRERLHNHADEQRRLTLLTNPDLSELETRISSRFHLWERRSDDPDFLSVRVGRGTQPISLKLLLPTLDITDPLQKDITQFEQDFSVVQDIPCSISLPKVKSLGITGRRQNVAAFAHGLLCQIATHHAPQDVRMLVMYPISQQNDWQWLQGLPHTLPLKSGKNIQGRLLAAGQEEADALLNILLEELSQRASNTADTSTQETNNLSAPHTTLPHLVVVVHDYVEVHRHPALANAFKLGEQLGVSIIYLVAQEESIPSDCRGILRISSFDETSDDTAHGSDMHVTNSEDTHCMVTYAAAGFAGERLNRVRADMMEIGMAHAVAHALSRVHFVEEGENIVNLPTEVRFLDLVGLPFADELPVERWWNSHPPFGMLRVPLGHGVNGPVWIDLNDSVHGPHGIIAGTTGAGKSELLQSLITGLAITHHPHLVNFVLVDFKGGATFKPFEKIPHTVGMVTDLSGRLTERALVALKSELRRREHMLSEANASNITQYQAMRDARVTENTLRGAQHAEALAQTIQATSSLAPLPHLFIVIDEFAELAKEHPAFMDGLVSIVRKGRSLGVHLILATQKPAGSVSPNIWSNLKFRICLRVASLQDSRDMLGRSEAALLPSTIPGRAYFQIGSETFDLFQGARTSLPARVKDKISLTTRQQEGWEQDVIDQQVLMAQLEPYQATVGAALFRPWPDPLPSRICLQDIYKRPDMPSHVVNAHANQEPLYGWVSFPVGLIDLPAEQRQVPFLLDLSRQDGHLLIAGSPGAGKSTFLRTILTSLVLTHSPEQLHLYVVDFHGQTLRVFERLPHVGGIFGQADEEYTRRLLRKLQGIIEERKQLFMTHQADGFLAYQRRRLVNKSLPAVPAVVLMINRFAEFRQAHEKSMDVLLALARHGQTYGVHLILTTDRPSAVPVQLLGLINTRIGLRMVESADASFLLGRGDAAQLDPTIPGRGFLRGKTLHEVQIALPVSGEDDDEQTEQLDRMVSALVTHEANEAKRRNEQHVFLAASPVQLLPTHIPFEDFILEAHSSPIRGISQASLLRLYLGIEDLSLQPFALELSVDVPHALIAGGPGSGRTNAIHTALLMLAATPAYASAQVVLVDFRHTSRQIRRLSNVWMYAETEERLIEIVDTLKHELQTRMRHIREELEQRNKQDSVQEESDKPLGSTLTPILLVIDDYEQLGNLTRNPLNDLKEFMLQARHLRFHMIVAGTPNDIARGDALLQQIRACRMGLILSGDPSDLSLLGMRISDLPPGRGYMVRRNRQYLMQLAHVDSQAIAPWITRLTHIAE